MVFRGREVDYNLEILDYLRANYPKAKFLFPSGKAVFGNYTVDENNHLSRRQLLRLIKPLDETL
jgi:hypothetical protein